MADTFPQSLAFLIAFWANGFLHGIYLVLFLRWLSLSTRTASKFYLVICWIGFISSNIDFGINLYLLLEGFWFYVPKGGPDAFFANLNNWPTVMREVNYQFLVSVCDAFMVYRLWRIWDGNYWITIIPILLLLFETAFGFMAATCLGLARFDLLPTAVNVFLGLNTALQVVITLVIGFRLLDPRLMKHLPRAHRARRYQLVRCVVESGLLVTVGIVIDLALFAENINLHWAFNISLTQLYAITTVLIILRMNNASSTNPTTISGISATAVSGGQSFQLSTTADYTQHPRAPKKYSADTETGYYENSATKTPVFGPGPTEVVDIGRYEDGGRGYGQRPSQPIEVQVRRHELTYTG